MLPKKLKNKLQQREDENALRKLGVPTNRIDFSSNDYLGFSSNKNISQAAAEILTRHNSAVNGASGSRLLTGNHAIYTETETVISAFHDSEAALIFNSGYDANLGFFSSVPQRGDVILYDELCHASIRDGIRMSTAKAFKFKHNSIDDIERLLSIQSQATINEQAIYLVTESVFSMDGDQPDLISIAAVCSRYNCRLIIDEAHAVGVYGINGRGLVPFLDLSNQVFARIITFGKALGCHGAAVLASDELKTYLINFARSFIYTTGLPPHSIATVQAAYHELKTDTQSQIDLKSNIAILQQLISSNKLSSLFIPSASAIHCCVIFGNTRVKNISEVLQEQGFDVKPILSPTVPAGEERLRICMHSFNTEKQIKNLVQHLSMLLKNNESHE